MTTDVRDEQPAKNGVMRRHAAGVMRAGVVDAELADLGAMCRHIADLARTRPEAPRRIRVEHMGTALEIEWPSASEAKQGSASPSAAASVVAAVPGSGAASSAAPAPGAAPGSAPAPNAAESAAPATDPRAAGDGLRRVCAPMIGTFYHAPEPGAPPFVAVGDLVAPGEQIGILEVMKMMSAVKADVAGTVREILVPDGGPVEFQQPLIAVEPVGDH